MAPIFVYFISSVADKSWLNSAKGKGFFSSLPGEATNSRSSPNGEGRNSSTLPYGREDSSKPLVSPARFTARISRLAPSRQKQAMRFSERHRQRRATLSDDDDCPAVMFADKILDRRKDNSCKELVLLIGFFNSLALFLSRCDPRLDWFVASEAKATMLAIGA